MLQSLREATEGNLQTLLSPRKNSLDSLFKEVRVFKVSACQRVQVQAVIVPTFARFPLGCSTTRQPPQSFSQGNLFV